MGRPRDGTHSRYLPRRFSHLRCGFSAIGTQRPYADGPKADLKLRTTGRPCGLADNVQARQPREHPIIQSIFSVGPVMLSAVVVVGRERDERDRLAMSALRPEADIWAGLQHAALCRYCSLIPGLGVKLSNDHPCRAHCSLRGRGKPSA